MLDANYSTTLATHASCEDFSSLALPCMWLSRDVRFCLLQLWIIILFFFLSLQKATANCSTLLLAALTEKSCTHIQRLVFERTAYRSATHNQHMNETEQHFQKAGPGRESRISFKDCITTGSTYSSWNIFSSVLTTVKMFYC